MKRFNDYLSTKNSTINKIVKIWSSFIGGDGVRRELWAKELYDELGISEQELDKLNRLLKGQYGDGWEDNTVSGHRILAGDNLWKKIKTSI